jgi:hypothetical protein
MHRLLISLSTFFYQGEKMKKNQILVFFSLVLLINTATLFGQNTQRYNLRLGYITRSAPFDNRSLERVARTFRFVDLNSSWFTDVTLQSGRTEFQIRDVLSQIGLTSSEQNAVFFEFRNSVGYSNVAIAIRFNYIDNENYHRFIHIERE